MPITCTDIPGFMVNTRSYWLPGPVRQFVVEVTLTSGAEALLEGLGVAGTADKVAAWAVMVPARSGVLVA